MPEITVHRALVWALFLLAGVTTLALTFLTAPYGRHARGGWGPLLGARAAWMLMESPAAFGFLAIYLQGAHRAALAPLVLLGIWQSHYAFRAVIYPLSLPREAKPMPLSVALLGFTFNVLNAYVNARWISHLATYTDGWLRSPWFLTGSALFYLGMGINRRSDRALLALRAPGETGYKIPRGGLFELVSCPNYLGELVEWFGWALLSYSLAGLSFAVYTAANLLPRAIAHHAWYRRTFEDYPAERRAVIPWVL